MTLALLALGVIVVAFAASAVPRSIELRRARRDARPLTPLRDPLTGLLTRHGVQPRLEQAISRARRYGHVVAVLAMDLERFADVNTRLGHDCGNEVLVAVGRRLSEVARAEDTVARLDGDQFAMVLEQVADASSPVRVAQRVEQAFAQPIALELHEVVVGLNIGVAIYFPDPFKETSAADVLRDALLAVQRAKQKGPRRIEIFDSELARQAIERLNLEARLRDAAQAGELLVYFQPEVALESGRILGMEALIRWRHPEQGLLLPGQFIPVAEETGLIVNLGRWVLENACEAAARLHRSGMVDPSFRINVNVSVRQLREDAGFLEHLSLVLARSGLAPAHLTVEITETSQELEPISPVLEQLRLMKVGVAIDDFGVGYSSLSRLRSLPISMVKIDRRFVDGIADPANFAVVRSITDLAAALGLEVTAEGIETPHQREKVRAAGCDRGQGFLFARAIPEAEFVKILLGARTPQLPVGAARVPADLKGGQP